MKHLYTVSVAKAQVSNNTICDAVDQYLGFLGLQPGLLCGAISTFINGLLNQFKTPAPVDGEN